MTMKKRIIIAFILFSINANSQITEPVKAYINSRVTYSDTFYTTYDTIPVLMLLSDTSRLVAPTYSVRGYKSVVTTFYQHDPIYLDERKRPLSKSLKIWIIYRL